MIPSSASIGTLALIGRCGLAGPLLSFASRGLLPAVVGEIAAGAVAGKTGFGWLDVGSSMVLFLSQVGFAMLMFNAGMRIPLSDDSLRSSLGRGTITAAIAAARALPAGILVSLLPGVGHPAIYIVLIASGLGGHRRPDHPGTRPEGRGRAGADHAGNGRPYRGGGGDPVGLAIGRGARRARHGRDGRMPAFLTTRLLQRSSRVHLLRREGMRRNWALDLRAALIALFTLAWVAQRTGASVLVSGFGAGLMLAAIGGPKRLSTEVLGAAGSFF